MDALVEVNWKSWRLAVNATNLPTKTSDASCLVRGDGFMDAPRDVMGTLGYSF